MTASSSCPSADNPAGAGSTTPTSASALALPPSPTPTEHDHVSSESSSGLTKSLALAQSTLDNAHAQAQVQAQAHAATSLPTAPPSPSAATLGQPSPSASMATATSTATGGLPTPTPDQVTSLSTCSPVSTSLPPNAVSTDDLYSLILDSFLNLLLIDVQSSLSGPIIVGSLRRRALRTSVPAASPFPRPLPSRLELCMRIQADERVMNADLIVFYDDAGEAGGVADQLAGIMASDGVFAAKYLHGGVTQFALDSPGLVELPGHPLPMRINDLRERQAALIQAVWYSHRSNTYDVPHLILPEYLYLGGQDAAHPYHLAAYGITHVIRIGFFGDLNLAPGVEYYTYTLEDAEGEPIEGLFDECCDVIDRARAMVVHRAKIDPATGQPQQGGPLSEVGSGRVLVHCHAGVSRSTTIVLIYMMRRLGYRLAEAFDLVFRARPIIRPNEGFGRKLQQAERALFGLEQSTMPLCWMSYDYQWYREYLEFLIRVEEMGLLESVLPMSDPELDPLAIAAEAASEASTTLTPAKVKACKSATTDDEEVDLSSALHADDDNVENAPPPSASTTASSSVTTAAAVAVASAVQVDMAAAAAAATPASHATAQVEA
ncbi:hypothetical protein BCR44DRAFT_1197885 [Catenaria anguillulae PL171]|uniref:protein-tyrosine-phosphatase n=1 Tax=Catenaria anguillulae PL171 TaxID=765915 RepID=A0A1Y2HK44_9FUNG|nr:hypothetical protein BCR44DRAFT_1197885 [Catenaria anguillulae PL171]